MSAAGERGAVVVTGASTGIGDACARHLAGVGFHVFAGVRSDEAAERIERSGLDRLVPLRIDVTDQGSIERAAAEVEAATGESGLAGLVNNAGVAVSGPLEFLPVDELRRQLDVNVVGQVAATQALLPALRRARGRVVNMGSIGGRMALPLLGPYNASKFALEGLTDCLRRELRPWGIEVVIVEPGAIATPIWDKSRAAGDELFAEMPPEAAQRYGAQAEVLRREAARAAAEGLPPQAVAEAVADALTAERPRTRYVVGRDAKGQAVITRLLPDRLVDRLVARTFRG